MLDASAYTAALKTKWLLCLSVSLCALTLTFWPQGLLHFRYERLALTQGELWRLASAHLVHVSGKHVLLNIAGLLLICELLWGELPLRHGLGLLAISAAGVNALLWLFQPELIWYAGLSGVLHGLWAGCALAACLPISKRLGGLSATNGIGQVRLGWIGLAGLLLLFVKLAIEMRFGASPQLEQAVGAPIISVAHMYGALSGAGYIVLCRSYLNWRRDA